MTFLLLSVGDKMGFTPEDEKVIAAVSGIRKISLGRTPLLASQCIVLAHHYLDGEF